MPTPIQSVINHGLTAHEISVAEGLADTRRQLGHVVKVTEDSANKTMDLVENLLTILRDLIESSEQIKSRCLSISADPRFQSTPEQNQLLLSFIAHLHTHSNTMRQGLNTVMETQGFQDISGQILNRVVALLANMENSLSDSAAGTPITPSTRSGSGPAIDASNDTHCNEQGDVDALLADLGI